MWSKLLQRIKQHVPWNFLLHRTPVANNGDIVIALIEDEATCKRFYKENGHYRLQPENELFEPIIVDEVVLLGTVISLVRNYE